MIDDGRHDLAVLDAEARRLVLALSPFGVLHRDALERECRAHSWHQATFKQALAHACKTGQIEELPLGFYGIPGHPGEPPGSGAHQSGHAPPHHASSDPGRPRHGFLRHGDPRHTSSQHPPASEHPASEAGTGAD